MIQTSFEMGVTHILENFTDEEIVGFDALYESMQKCKRNVIWKNSAAFYYLHGIEETLELEKKLKNGTYKAKPPKKFTITHPKKREAVSIAFRDRVYQRSMNDNCIYPIMTKSFIYDNMACQKRKGSACARDRLDEFLHKFYRHHKLNGYVLQCDIKGYYPNMNHKVAEELFEKRLPRSVYERSIVVLHEQYGGEKGYNPGSQMIQILGISLLDALDHYIKERLRVKYYLRYMDDFVLIHEDAAYLEQCKTKISGYLKTISCELHPKKTRIYSLSSGIKLLGFTHKLTPSGKIIRLINPQNVKNERRKLKRMVKLSKAGKLPKEKVDECFQAWRAHAKIGNSFKLLQRMDSYYEELWKDD